MKYFTKDWYRDSLASDICFQLKSSAKAAKPSEKYFSSLYAAQEKWSVKQSRRIMGSAFNAEDARREFQKNYDENLTFVKASIPEEILEKVPDVRLLALGVADSETVQAIARHCGKLARRCEKTQNDYDERLEALAEELGWLKINTLNLIIGAPITSATREGDAYVIETGADNTDIACKLQLFNANVTSSDTIVGSVVLQLEILGEGDKLELNLLCENKDGELCEFSSTVTDLENEEING